MKIKMLTGLSGPEYNLAPGDERDFEDAEAIRLVSAGFAVPAEAAPSETTSKKAAAKTRKKG